MRQNSYNQVAYRILLLLHWLSEKPLTFQEINHRFETEPGIEKRVSQDTLWFYINTLKALGCEISRPAPRNGYCYELRYHPFSHFLTPRDIQTFKEVITQTDERFDHWDLIYFNHWLKRMFETAANRRRQEMMDQFFRDIRTRDFKHLEGLMKQLEMYCEAKQLLMLQYHSATKGLEDLLFLPQKLFQHLGNIYLLGYTPEANNASMLRLDRIEHVKPYEDDKVRNALLQKQREKQVFVIRLLNCTKTSYETLEEEDEEIYADPITPEHLLVRLRSENEFLLKQKLLSSGYLFQVLHPAHFKEDLYQSLLEMRQMYA